MYESPITIEIREISRKYVEEIDNLVLNEIRKYDIQVNKDELIKAMKYDRDQYNKGFADGRKETAQEILQEFFKTFVEYTCVGDYYTEIEIYNKIQELANKYSIELEY